MMAFTSARRRHGVTVAVRLLPLLVVVLATALAVVSAEAASLAASDAVVVPAGPANSVISGGTPAPAKAPGGQVLPGSKDGKDGKAPVNIQADNAIEWHQDQKAYVARGNASAVRGTTTVYADILTAYYRETKEKGTDVYRMTAEGNVRIVSPTQQVFGEHGVYDVDRQMGVITGRNLKLVTATDIVVARDSLEYYDGTKLAVARGDAIAVRGDNRLRADTLVAQFKEDAGGGLVMDRLDGIGGVVITTPTDVAVCRRVMHSVASDISILVGDVKITRGEDQVNGDAAEMNMKTHVNRVLSNGRRVEGLLTPKDQKDEQKTGKPGGDHKGGKSAASAPAASARQ